jgi:phosphohistidine phosphatase SixA
MLLILMRHAAKAPEGAPLVDNAPLLAADEETIQWREDHRSRLEDGLLPVADLDPQPLLGKNPWLRRLDQVPDLICTSKYTHAWQTGHLLGTAMGVPPDRVRNLWALTPKGLPIVGEMELSFAHVVSELERQAIVPSRIGLAIFVGHRPRIDELLKNLSGGPRRHLDYGEAVRVQGNYRDCCARQAVIVGEESGNVE